MVCDKSAGSFVILMLFSSISTCSYLRVLGSPGPWVPFRYPKNWLTAVELGTYVVHEHNRQDQTHLRFEHVVEGFSQVDGDVLNFRIVVSAKNGNMSRMYEAMVHEQPKRHFRNLASFTRV